MNRILFIDDNIKYSSFELSQLKMMGYKIDIIENESHIESLLRKNNYKFIIIDLEFGNSRGDIICINIRKNINQKIPIIGIYGYNKKCSIKTYQLCFFNNLSSKPVIDWKNILQDSYNINFSNSNKYDNWLNNEKLINKHLCKSVFGLRLK